jgi:putative Holliday junction resolvase
MGGEVTGMARILAVDPGDVRIGLAISDPSGVIARPLKVIRHQSRQKDVECILHEAERECADIILVGVALDFEGREGPQARKAIRLVRALQEQTKKAIITRDESGSSQRARALKKKDSMLDAHAAAFLLQEYLDESQA